MTQMRKHYTRSREILKTAELMFRQKGFDSTEVRDITSHLEINETEFFVHFESLDEILELLWAGSAKF